jgi:hypothetical protein
VVILYNATLHDKGPPYLIFGEGIVLLKADRSCGWTNADMALAYEVSTKKVEPRKKRFVEEGFDAALSRKPVTNAHRRKITGEEEAHLIALYCRQAPEGHERWT